MKQFKFQACTNSQRLNKNAFKVMFEIGSRTREFLDGLEDWTILSFNPQTYEVCIELTTRSGTRIISLTIPSLKSE